MNKERDELMQRLALMKKKLAKKQQQYTKRVSLSKAKAHVKQKLLEQENLRKYQDLETSLPKSQNDSESSARKILLDHAPSDKGNVCSLKKNYVKPNAKEKKKDFIQQCENYVFDSAINIFDGNKNTNLCEASEKPKEHDDQRQNSLLNKTRENETFSPNQRNCCVRDTDEITSTSNCHGVSSLGTMGREPVTEDPTESVAQPTGENEFKSEVGTERSDNVNIIPPTQLDSSTKQICHAQTSKIVSANKNMDTVAKMCSEDLCQFSIQDFKKKVQVDENTTYLLDTGGCSSEQSVSASGSGSSIESIESAGKRQLSLKRKRHSVNGSVGINHSGTKTKCRYQEIKEHHEKNRRYSDTFSEKIIREACNTENVHRNTGKKCTKKLPATFDNLRNNDKSIQKDECTNPKKRMKKMAASVSSSSLGNVMENKSQEKANSCKKESNHVLNNSSLGFEDVKSGYHKKENDETSEDTSSDIRHGNMSPAESQELDTLILLQESYRIDTDYNTRKTRRSSHQPVMLSSVFQFIIDEAKRKERIQCFDLPLSSYGKLMKKKLKGLQKTLTHSMENTEDDLQFSMNSNGSCSELEIKDNVKFPAYEGRQCNISETDSLKISRKFKQKRRSLKSKISVNDKKKCLSDNYQEMIGVVVPDNVELSDVQENVTKLPDSEGSVKESCVSTKHTYITESEPLFSQTPEEKLNSDNYIEQDKEISVPDNEADSENMDTGNSQNCSDLNQDADEDSRQKSMEIDSTIHLSHAEECTGILGDEVPHLCSVQFPEDGPLLSLDVWTLFRRRDKEVLVSLCENSLTLWRLSDSQFTCLQKWSFDKGQRGVKGTLLASKSSKLTYGVVLSDGCNVSLHIALYEEDRGHSLFQLVDLVSDRCHLCGVNNSEILLSDGNNSCIQVSKYTLDTGAKRVSNMCALEVTAGVLESLHVIQGLPAAVGGYAADGLIHIWNHEKGSLLVTVNLAVFWSHPSMIVSVIHEKGFLFISKLKKTEGVEAGCVMLVNPSNCQTKVLHQYQSNTWKGCTETFHLQDYSAGLDVDGTLCLWDLYTGDIVSRSKQPSMSAFCQFKNNIFIGHKNCVHLFQR